jgi:hypothetical protein
MEHEVVMALAFLEGTSSAEVIRAAVAEFLNQQANDADVLELMRVRTERRAKREGTVAPLRNRPRRSG